ncbi:MAG: PilW family protein [Pseudomonadota bacterium]
MKNTRGFTLVEVMIAMAIGLIVVGGVAAVLISSSSLYRSSSNRARLQENSRFALGAMQEDVRMAGYMGCFNIRMYPGHFTNLAGTGFATDYRTLVGGHEAGATGWLPALNASVGNGGHAPLAGSDVLVVRVPVGPSQPLSAPMTTSSTPIFVADTSDFSVGGLAIISNCSYANVFVVTNIASGDRLLHAHAAGGNSDAHLTRVFSNTQRATVTPLATVSYFLANASNGVAGNHALFRQQGSGAAEEVADGVEQMQIEYGIDTDLPPDMVPNKFVTANQIGAAPVIAIKVSVLLRSVENNVVRAAQHYNFDGNVDVTPTDRRLYTPFTTTIALRNRGD